MLTRRYAIKDSVSRWINSGLYSREEAERQAIEKAKNNPGLIIEVIEIGPSVSMAYATTELRRFDTLPGGEPTANPGTPLTGEQQEAPTPAVRQSAA